METSRVFFPGRVFGMLRNHVDEEQIQKYVKEHFVGNLSRYACIAIKYGYHKFADQCINAAENMDDLWCIEDKAYRDKIAPKYCYFEEKMEREMIIQNQNCTTDAPAVYQAILRGDTEWLKDFEKYLFPNVKDPRRYDKVLFKRKEFRFSSPTQYQCAYFLIRDPLTAAAWSNDLKMVKYIFETTIHPSWTQGADGKPERLKEDTAFDEYYGMLLAISESSEDVTQYLLENFSTYTDQIPPSVIIDAGNEELLKSYLQRHPDEYQQCLEMHLYNRECPEPNDQVPWTYAKENIDRRIFLYQAFLTCAPDQQMREIVLQKVRKELAKRTYYIDEQGRRVDLEDADIAPSMIEKLALRNIYEQFAVKTIVGSQI